MAKKVCCVAAMVLVFAGAAMGARIRVGSLVQENKLANFVRPQYPPLAKQARVQGKVELEVLIGVDGSVLDVTPKTGDALLVEAAVAAVRQWQYQPTFLNGEPVEVATTVTVNFALNEQGQEMAAVPGSQQGRRLVNHVQPEYPPLARQARIQGSVKFEARIAADGALKSLRVISGHPQLVQAAMDAVRQWKYEPLVIDGQPVEVVTDIDVNFTLSGQPDGALRVGGSEQQKKLISNPPPVYPPLAKQAGIQGTVLLGVTVGKDGAATYITVISGHPLLAEAAVEAVKNWRWEPTLLNGEPVEVITQVHVNFTLASTP